MPTRELSIRLNFYNSNLGILLRFTISVYRSDTGNFFIDYATIRLTEGKQQTFKYTATIVSITNIALFIILMMNIKAQRNEQWLIEKE